MARSIIVRRLWLLGALGLGCAFISGCARWDWRGPGFNDGTATWARPARRPNGDAQVSGLDGRAQEIERNLGVR